MPTQLASINVESLKGIGPKVAEKLHRIGIFNVEDLLFHLPNKYQDRSRVHPIATLRQGDYAQVCGEIESANIVFGKRRSLVCKISDGSGVLDIRLFYFSMAQKKQLVTGQFIQCYGQATLVGRNFSMIHPELIYLKDSNQPKLEQGLKAIYPTTEGLQQKALAAMMRQALVELGRAKVSELLPEEWLAKLNFPPLVDALKLLHNPPLDLSIESLQNGNHPLIKRLAFEELTARHIALQNVKAKVRRLSAQMIPPVSALARKLTEKLPFELTKAQRRVIAEINQDLKQNYPMMRLVQGDVGSGKTLVAAMVMLDCVAAGFQVALMAPTEILAEQHFKSFSEWCTEMPVKVTLLTSKLPAAEKKSALASIKDGSAKIVIGTHAIFQNQVAFSELSLVVIDEQHRFGVEQRKQLLEKGLDANKGRYHPHQLVMTATPIPRTLAQTAFADLDLSVIDELPPGRQPVATVALPNSRREALIQRVATACAEESRQVYWVCTLIEDSEELQCQAAEVTFQQLQTALPDLKLGLIHGRLKPLEKQQVMKDFKAGKLDLLVATTVIEVGVDVPNASLMVIENPERLGLSQLHQLRGRVGRGAIESHCILLYQAPLSKNGQQRLAVMRETNDGFVVAEKDLELRGPGEVLGTRQTGALEYRFADIIRDSELLPEVTTCADSISQSSPKLAKALCLRWIRQGDQLSRV